MGSKGVQLCLLHFPVKDVCFGMCHAAFFVIANHTRFVLFVCLCYLLSID